MKYKKILITGGAGFVGSNLAVYFKKKYPSVEVIALDNLKRRGSEMNLLRLKENEVCFLHGDIRSQEDLNLDFKIDLLIECSAEPAVLAGYGNNPLYVVNTNLVGTINCLELARKNNADVIFLSSSRVYPYEAINALKTKELSTRLIWNKDQKIPGWSESGIDTNFTLSGPKTLYGATKLASELILQEYIASYGIKGIINRCGIIAGPWQFGKSDQGVFTFWMLTHYFKKELKYIGFGGKGKQVRDLLHIEDLFELLDLELESLNKINGNIYNVGGGELSSLSLREATTICEEISGNQLKISSDLKGRPGDIAIYLTDNKKVTQDLGWQPRKNPHQILLDVFTWIRANENQIRQAFF